MKRCPCCGRDLPLEAYSPSNRTRNGTYCRECGRECNRRYVAANREYVNAYQKAYREKHAAKLKPRTKERARASYERNRAKVLERTAAWHRNNPDKVRETQRRYCERNVEVRRIRSRRYYKTHPEKNRQHASAWRARARRTQVEPVDYNAIWERDQGICHICSLPVERSDVQFDHVIPLSRGGTHTAENVKVSHSVCNNRKRARFLSELDWIA